MNGLGDVVHPDPVRRVQIRDRARNLQDSVVGAGAGYFSGGSVPVDNVAPGATGVAEVRAWESSGGNTWDQALDAGARVGQSSEFEQTTGGAGSPPGLPLNMVNFEGFGMLPEPSATTFLVLGGIAMMLRRRR